MAKLTVLILCALIPSLIAQCTVEKAQTSFSRAVYEFSVDLISRIAQENDNHFVSSTLSTWVLISCLSLGASDTTLKEMKDVLSLHSHKCFNKKYLEISKIIQPTNDTDVVFEKNSYIFASDQITILDEYKMRLSQTGVSDIETMSFGDPDAAAQIINSYTSRATHDTIDEIVSSGDFENTLMIMVDAIYFKGAWEIPFSYEKTTVSEFFNVKGDHIGDVNLMSMENLFNVRYVKMIGAKVLELPYGQNNQFSMLFILPDEGTTLGTLIQNLKKISLVTIYKLFEEFGEIDCSVKIPRFRISSDLNNLKELLADMGLKTMFDSNRASFPLISDFPLYVSNFVQKAVIEVTEEGTTASAVTKAELGFRSLPSEFHANRPFLYMIVEKEIKVPIFIGAYAEPSLY